MKYWQEFFWIFRSGKKYQLWTRKRTCKQKKEKITQDQHAIVSSIDHLLLNGIFKYLWGTFPSKIGDKRKLVLKNKLSYCWLGEFTACKKVWHGKYFSNEMVNAYIIALTRLTKVVDILGFFLNYDKSWTFGLRINMEEFCHIWTGSLIEVDIIF